jgi:hypothetical protein
MKTTSSKFHRTPLTPCDDRNGNTVQAFGTQEVEFGYSEDTTHILGDCSLRIDDWDTGIGKRVLSKS